MRLLFREDEFLHKKEFLDKKINDRDVYVDYGSTEYIPEDACSLRLYGDLTVLN